ncbi:hypothetical protein [Lactovum miscens]|uniref:Quinol monooxygenase YgiN n=1 Tax=Lactovum miscens TaxID=190387 RepID=A0A841C5U4_9LACT|nr:hypothetical protein [Lactovum miscens]MBB5887647.1 quinol monooxygenase YgiN [Lactovum miscens]
MTKLFLRLVKQSLGFAYAEVYVKVGFRNVTNSINNEVGLLVMYVNHLKSDLSKNIVAELYADKVAHQGNISSDYFQKFADLAVNALNSREIISLNTKAVLEKD